MMIDEEILIEGPQFISSILEDWRINVYVVHQQSYEQKTVNQKSCDYTSLLHRLEIRQDKISQGTKLKARVGARMRVGALDYAPRFSALSEGDKWEWERRGTTVRRKIQPDK